MDRPGALRIVNLEPGPAIDEDPARAPAALASWAFRGHLRQYQAEVLERIHAGPGDALHIVAPPGAGKTLLGLLLAARAGNRTVVLVPNTVVRAQWAQAGRDLAGDPAAVSEDPERLADLTVLTYQALSVLDIADPLTELARSGWLGELVTGGRDEAAATAWLTTLGDQNPAAYRSGIGRRSRALRRQLARTDPATLAAALHPNARLLAEAIVQHGVTTIVLDECHHLLDHWALVVSHLAGLIRSRGHGPLLIGLTATLPSPDDAAEYDNYTGLLGEVDFEVPTPAVVREGNLAPYRDFGWFVAPTPAEVSFLAEQDRRLAELVERQLADPEGLEWLAAVLQPRPDAAATIDPLRDLGQAFADDFALAAAAARMLRRLAPEHPLIPLLPTAEADQPPSTEEALRLIARHALDRLLPNPELAQRCTDTCRTLADYGLNLSDGGLRRTRSPFDSVLAQSEAKDAAVADILRLELGESCGDRVRAVVVTDFAQHGNRRGGDPVAAGALRCFDTIISDPALALLRPVLVTARHLRIARRDTAAMVALLERQTGRRATTTPAGDGGLAVEVELEGCSAADALSAVSALLTEGSCRLVVGTRGLLGEGWDCPAANTLIDLTAAATSSATQQLRGRTIRLDPGWTQKVAHNWTVTCVIGADVAIDETPDLDRLERKHARTWGLHADGGGGIVRGIDHALHSSQQVALENLRHKVAGSSVGAANRAVLDGLPDRAHTRAEWRIGQPYTGTEQQELRLVGDGASPFRTGPTLELALSSATAALGTAGGMGLVWLAGAAADPVALAVGGGAMLAAVGLLGVPLVRALLGPLRQRLFPRAAYRDAALAVLGTLRGMESVLESGPAELSVTADPDRPYGWVVALDGPLAEQVLLADCLRELFGPIRIPRFLLQVNSGSSAWHSPLLAAAFGLADRASSQACYLPVPAMIGRRRQDAQAFALQWTQRVGPCTLHEIDGPEELSLLAMARTSGVTLAQSARVTERWA